MVGVLLLAAVAAGPAGWLAGLAYVVGLLLLLGRAVRRADATTLGPAGLVTLARALLVGCVTTLIADGVATGSTPVALLVGLAAAALVLDAVDGWVARRTDTATALGARFDMEVDSFLLLVLSVHVAGLVGPWALAIGLLRYAFVAAGWAAPWLRRTLPPRYSAKVVAAVAGVVLVTVASELLPTPATTALVAATLALLVWSFTHDVVRLWR